MCNCVCGYSGSVQCVCRVGVCNVCVYSGSVQCVTSGSVQRDCVCVGVVGVYSVCTVEM